MKKWKILLSCVVVAALVAAGVGLVVQHRRLGNVSAELETAGQALQQAEAGKQEQAARQEQLEQQKKELEQKLKDTEDALKASQEEQDKLKKEKESLQQQLALLSSQKKENDSASAGTPIPGKVCYLTFDDGPSAVTPQVLDTLKQYGVKATFFVVGAYCTGDNNVKLLKRMVDEGHTVALHCDNHTYAKVYASEAAYFADLNAVSRKVEAATGVKSRVVRFPGGTSNTASSYYTKGLMTALSQKLPEMGYAYFDWNVSSGDAAGGVQSAATIKNNVLTRARGQNKICVLMHDGGGKKTTAQALPGIIEGLRQQGYSFAALTPEVEGFKQRANN